MTTPDEAQILTFDTALGRCGLRWSAAGISAVHMPGTPAAQRLEHACAPLPPPEVRRAADLISTLLDGERTDLRDVGLDMTGLDGFRRRVYELARRIPPGRTTTYGEIARALGSPGAAREVGSALARNPFPIIVPCHRVLAATGELHGFSAPGGIATKRRMLEIEAAPGFAQQPLFA
jgi:methylated-DNA-[protein]-cysteine S-methyltransferase